MNRNPTYRITRERKESPDDFATRVFNEVRIMNCKIINVHVEMRTRKSDDFFTNPFAFVIEYQNFSPDGFVPPKEYKNG